MLSRLRNALILGAVWGVVWLAVGLAISVAIPGIRIPPRATSWLLWLGMWAGLGIASGAAFAYLLARMERGRALETLAPTRLIVWGLLAGAGVPIVLSAVMLALLPPDVHLAPSAYAVFALTGATGGACAVATIAVAKHDAHIAASAPPT